MPSVLHRSNTSTSRSKPGRGRGVSPARGSPRACILVKRRLTRVMPDLLEGEDRPSLHGRCTCTAVLPNRTTLRHRTCSWPISTVRCRVHTRRCRTTRDRDHLLGKACCSRTRVRGPCEAASARRLLAEKVALADVPVAAPLPRTARRSVGWLWAKSGRASHVGEGALRTQTLFLHGGAGPLRGIRSQAAR